MAKIEALKYARTHTHLLAADMTDDLDNGSMHVHLFIWHVSHSQNTTALYVLIKPLSLTH